MHTATLVSARTLSPVVRELTFDAGASFRFVPGQFVSFRIPQPNGEMLPRSYSVASPPREDHRFEVAVTLVENGPGSTCLHGLRVGEQLTMSHAQGFFTLDPPVRPVLFVGTGTGVAPLRSMLVAAREEFAAEKLRVALLFGARTEADLLYREEFEQLARDWPEFHFAPTLSRADDRWTGLRGYVQLHVPAVLAHLGATSDVYLCGLNKMVKEVRKVLKDPVGYPRERVHSERYD